jgi:hypothetical protein
MESGQVEKAMEAMVQSEPVINAVEPPMDRNVAAVTTKGTMKKTCRAIQAKAIYL